MSLFGAARQKRARMNGGATREKEAWKPLRQFVLSPPLGREPEEACCLKKGLLSDC